MTVTRNESSLETVAVTCNSCKMDGRIYWDYGSRRDSISSPHCRTCHRDDHQACWTCGTCLPRCSRWDRRFCSSTCRVKGHLEREDAKLERAVWEAENPEEAATQLAEHEKRMAEIMALGEAHAPGGRERIERHRRMKDLKARADRCATCGEPFSADAVIYRRRFWATEIREITSPVLPFCAGHRCGQQDGYHNRDAPEGSYYPACRCEDRHWETPKPCVGCRRPVSHPRNAKWRWVRDWAYPGESVPAMPRVFCGLACKRTVLTAEARAKRRAARSDCATCSICKSQFTPKRSDSRYCSSRCRQAAYRQRRNANAS